LLAKSIVPSDDARPRWTATPIPTNTPTPSPTPNPTFVSSAYGLGTYMPENIGRDERWIDVNLTEQKLVAYEGLIPVFETLVSTGTARYPTVTGQFRIWLRFRAQDMDGYRLGYDYYLKDVPYVQYFYEDYALHGTFWHNNFGQPMSHGCVNLDTADAEWLYGWAGYGTLVNVHP
jgi:lipoprotein-anchoring transpeptidase ErfK/SrfK